VRNEEHPLRLTSIERSEKSLAEPGCRNDEGSRFPVLPKAVEFAKRQLLDLARANLGTILIGELNAGWRLNAGKTA
jgi:hypothetical protein